MGFWLDYFLVDYKENLLSFSFRDLACATDDPKNKTT